MKIISFIIPVFNGQSFIKDCILSIANQNLDPKNYEIIVINDGSPDNSLSIVKQMQETIKNIVTIDQENAGVCVARNNGIKEAAGDWVLFVDQDDYLIPETLNEIYEHLINLRDHDVVMFPSRFQKKNEVFKYEKKHSNEKLFGPLEGIDFYHEYRKLGPSITGLDAPWGICYKKSFLIANNLFFVEDVIYLDDAEFLGRVFCLAKACSFIDFPYYVHKNNPSSVSNSSVVNSLKAIKGFIKAADNLNRFKKNSSLSVKQKEFINGLAPY